MISDDFETFIDDNFWRWHTKTKILVKKIIHFIKIQNIHSIKIFIFLKSRIFIQTKYSFFLNPEYSFKQNIHFFKIQNIHSNKIFIFLKRAVSNRATWNWIKRLIQWWKGLKEPGHAKFVARRMVWNQTLRNTSKEFILMDTHTLVCTVLRTSGQVHVSSKHRNSGKD